MKKNYNFYIIKHLLVNCKKTTLIFCLFFALFICSAQTTINWHDNTPSQSNALVALGDTGYLYINALITGTSLVNPVVEIIVPPGVEFIGSTKATMLINEPGSSYSCIDNNITLLPMTRTATLNYTCNGNMLYAGDSIVLKVKLRATYGINPSNPGNFTVNIKGSGFVSNGNQIFPANLIKPTLRIVPTPANISGTIGTPTNVTIDIDAALGHTYSTLVTLSYDGAALTLNNFKINGTPLGSAPSATSGLGVFIKSPANAQAQAVIRLNHTVMNGKLDNTPRTITFDATAKYGCTKIIETKIQNTLDVNYESWAGTPVTIVLPGGLDILPQFTHAGVFLASKDFNTSSTINYTQFCWNGSAPAYWIKNTFTNTNGVAIADLQFMAVAIAHALGNCAYIDENQVWYRINGGAEQLIPSSNIVKSNTYTNAATHAPAILGKAPSVTINFPFTVANPAPANAVIEVIYPVYGNPIWLLDAYRTSTDEMFYTPNGSNFYTVYRNGYATNTCGSTSNIVPTTYYIPNTQNRSMPRFAYAPQSSFVVYPEMGTTITNGFSSGDINDAGGARYAEIFVKVPNWLQLDPTNSSDPITSAFVVENTNNHNLTYPVANSGVNHGSDSKFTTYSVKYYSSASGDLHIRVMADPCTSTTENTQDTITFWTDWVSGTSDPSCRPRFQKTSKTWSIVTRVCEVPPIIPLEAGPFRISRGLQDSDDNHIPDAGFHPALDNEMDHTVFQQKDTGYYYYKCVMSGDANMKYSNFKTEWNYIINSNISAVEQYFWANGNTLPNNISTGVTVPIRNLATLEVKRPTSPFTLNPTINIPVSSSQTQKGLEVLCNTTLQGGDTCYFKIPFYCLWGYSTVNIVNKIGWGGFSVTATADMQYNGGAVEQGMSVSGDFKLFVKRSFLQNSSISPANFTQPCDPVKVGYISIRSGHDAIDWEKEVRYQHTPDSVVIFLPHGFARTSNTIGIQTFRYIINHFPLSNEFTSTKEVTPDRVSVNATGDSIFTIYLYNHIDYSYYDGKPGYSIDANGLITPGDLLIPGDDRTNVQCYFTNLIATPGAAAGTNNKLTGTFYYKNTYGNPQSAVSYIDLNYTGDKLYLSTFPKTLQVNSDQLLLQSVELNTNTTNNDVWLFVQGNVKDAYLINFTTTDTILAGIGLNNCWLHLEQILPNITNSYRLIFTYKENPDCANDTLTVYSILSYNPDINKGIEDVPMCYKGQAQITVLDMQNIKPKVAGTIETDIPDEKLSYFVPYLIDYSLIGKVSQGALYDPYMVITVPEGQVYSDTTVHGIATYTYPVGAAPRDIPQLIRDRLKLSIGEDSDAEIERTDTVWVKELLAADGVTFLAGWGTDLFFGVEDSSRIVSIQLPFIPTCETDMLGIRFKGDFHGFKICGDPCEDDGYKFVTPPIYTDIEPGYTFFVDLHNLNLTHRTFTPHHTIDTLVATFFKNSGLENEIEDDDYIRLALPQDFSINGTVESPEYGTITIINDTMIGTQHVYYLELPITALNDSIIFETSDTPFQYIIPILYTPDPSGECKSDKEEHECEVNVVTFKSFGEECEERLISVGKDYMNVLNLNFDNVTFDICPNVDNNLEVSCYGITLEWYNNEDGTGTPLAIGNFMYHPTEVKDTLFYIRAFWDYGGPDMEDFGVAPIEVHVLPEVIADFEADTVRIGNPTTFTNLSTGDITNYYWYLDGETEPFSTDENPQEILPEGTHNVTLKVESSEGCFNEITLEVVVEPQPEMVPLTLTVFLQGPTQPDGAGSGVMTNYIQTADPIYSVFPTGPKLPEHDPYGLGAYYADAHNIYGPAGEVVDWISVEIWDVDLPNYEYTIKQPAVALLLKPDGSVVDTDGNIPQFEPQPDSVYIVVKHRNHLAIVSNKIDLSKPATYDFSIGLGQVLKFDWEMVIPMMIFKNGKWTMLAGDFEGENYVTYIDYLVLDQAFVNNVSDVYVSVDVNMNGYMDYLDFFMIEQNFNTSSYSILNNLWISGAKSKQEIQQLLKQNQQLLKQNQQNNK